MFEPLAAVVYPVVAQEAHHPYLQLEIDVSTSYASETECYC
jgi:hypothetical protein